MSLRIKSEEDFENLNARHRVQVQQAMAATPLAPRSEIHRPEQEAGRKLVTWADNYRLPAPWDPCVEIVLGEYFAHVPNGGARNAVEGGILKGQGVRKGYPDYILDLAVGRYHGFRLELKSEDGASPDRDQLDLMWRLERAGLKCAVAWGFDDAKRATLAYLAETE